MEKNPQIPTTLQSDDRKLLLRLARAALYSHQRGLALDLSSYDRESLRRPAGAFVTWKLDGELRGCIGNVVASGPLLEAVAANAVSAAARDPRFEPVSANEAERLELEISVLSPMTEVHDLEEIVVGRDGLMVRLGGRGGLLLPQVAGEYGWDRQEFLRQTCRKAGLPRDAYLDPLCKVEKFTAEVFSEDTDT